MSKSKPKSSDGKVEPERPEVIDIGTGIEVENIAGGDLITEPFDPTLIRVETRVMTIDLILSRIREHEIDLTPGFQRHAGLWTVQAQSRLIESILIRIPLPAFYMDATEEGRWLVVDGLQRLTTLKNFVLDKSLKLDGLEFLSNLQGNSYDKLPRNFQRRIGETQVTVYLIEHGTPPQVKFNIFKRINTGGLPLSPQEIRHALNQGQVTEVLARLAASKEFKAATDEGIKDDRMADRECVLRYIAFSLVPYKEYKKPDFDSFLNESMASLNKMDMAKLGIIEKGFLRSMKAARRIFGNDAFRKRFSALDARSPINKALFEAWSVNLGRLTDLQIEVLTKNADRLKAGFMDLLKKDVFFAESISQGTGDISKVKRRFGAIEDLIREVLR